MVKSEKLLLAPPPLMITPAVPIDPGCEPSMVTFLVITSVESRLITTTFVAKLMVSPADPSASAARNEPTPLSAPVVTVIVVITSFQPASGYPCRSWFKPFARPSH